MSLFLELFLHPPFQNSGENTAPLAVLGALLVFSLLSCSELCTYHPVRCRTVFIAACTY